MNKININNLNINVSSNWEDIAKDNTTLNSIFNKIDMLDGRNDGIVSEKEKKTLFEYFEKAKESFNHKNNDGSFSEEELRTIDANMQVSKTNTEEKMTVGNKIKYNDFEITLIKYDANANAWDAEFISPEGKSVSKEEFLSRNNLTAATMATFANDNGDLSKGAVGHFLKTTLEFTLPETTASDTKTENEVDTKACKTQAANETENVRKNSSVSADVANMSTENKKDGAFYYNKKTDFDRHQGKVESFDIIKDLYENINMERLARITPSNVAFIYKEYKNYGKNKSGINLSEAIDNVFLLDIDTVKNSICKNLAIRAKELGIKEDDYNKYLDIKDIKELDKWIMKTIESLDNATDKVVIDENNENFAEQGIERVEIYTKESAAKAIYYYTNDKIVEEYVNGKNGTVRALITPENNPQKVVHAPVAGGATPEGIKIQFEGGNENARKIALALEEHKPELMKRLNLDNETYNNYARLTMAIIERETQFGEGCVGYDEDGKEFETSKFKYGVQQATADFSNSSIYSPSALADRAVGNGIKGFKRLRDGKNMSFGMSGIKYDTIVEESRKDTEVGRLYKQVLTNFEAMGIQNETDLYDPEKCALATIIYARAHTDLADATIRANAEKNTKNNTGKHVNANLETAIQACPCYGITEYDVVANTWNRGFSYIQDGTMNPYDWEYNTSVRKNMQKYEIVNQ